MPTTVSSLFHVSYILLLILMPVSQAESDHLPEPMQSVLAVESFHGTLAQYGRLMLRQTSITQTSPKDFARDSSQEEVCSDHAPPRLAWRCWDGSSAASSGCNLQFLLIARRLLLHVRSHLLSCASQAIKRFN